MERVLFGDNQFFAVNHISDEKSIQQAIRFRDLSSIIKTLDYAIDAGINTFVCTTHDRIAQVCDHMRQNPDRYKDFNICPAMPYAHKYANAFTELGIVKFINQYIPGNKLATLSAGGMALLGKDFKKMLQLLVDSEMKMFHGISTPMVFLQNVMTDLLLGLGMIDLLVEFNDYIERKYNARAGFMTMNLPYLSETLIDAGVKRPVVCSSINKIGFRMTGGLAAYEEYLKQDKVDCIAMQVLAAGAISPREAFEYVSKIDGVKSILFGASSKGHIEDSYKQIHEFSGN